MIERGRQILGAAAVPLIHAHHVHPRPQPLLGDAQHVFRLARTLKAMHDDNRHRVLALRLPVAMTENLDAWLHFDQASFPRREGHPATQEKAGDGLDMSALQAATGPKS